MDAISRGRMTDQVLHVLRERIVSGDLAAGSRVDVESLAAELGVSRTPVREAVLQLEAAGLVERQPYRGTVVSGIDPSRLEEVTALRIDLEGRATTLGVERLSAHDLERMRTIHAELKAHEGDAAFAFRRFNVLNREFHALIYDAADAPTLARLIASLNDEADRMRLHVDMRHANAETFHARILEACERRDPAAARDATQRHLLETYLAMRGDRLVPPGILADVLRDAGIEVPR